MLTISYNYFLKPQQRFIRTYNPYKTFIRPLNTQADSTEKQNIKPPLMRESLIMFMLISVTLLSATYGYHDQISLFEERMKIDDEIVLDLDDLAKKTAEELILDKFTTGSTVVLLTCFGYGLGICLARYFGY